LTLAFVAPCALWHVASSSVSSFLLDNARANPFD
jgi:hypothetical protein